MKKKTKHVDPEPTSVLIVFVARNIQELWPNSLQLFDISVVPDLRNIMISSENMKHM